MAAHPPKWANFLHAYADSEFLGKNQSTGAVLFMPVEDRLLVVTFV